MEFSFKAVLESVLIGVISTLIVMVLIFIPILNMAVPLFAIPFIVLGVRRGVWSGIAGLILSSALLAIIIHPFFGIIMFILNIFQIVGGTWAFKKRMQLNESIVLSAAAILVSIIAAYQAFSLMAGQDFFEFLWESIEKFFAANSNSITALIELYQGLGLLDKAYSVKEFTKLLIGQMKDLMPLIPSALLNYSVALGAAVFLLSRLVLKRLQIFVLPVPKFRTWSLPRGTSRGFLTMLAISFIGMLVGIENFDVVFYTVLQLFSFIFAIQGLATAAFFLRLGRLPRAVQVLMLIAASIFMVQALTFIGLFDQIFNLRRNYLGRPQG